MGQRKKLVRPARRKPIGDLRDLITLQNRSITPPDEGEVDADHLFVPSSVVWASVETTSGETLFDGVGQDDPITHRVTIRWVAGVTAESWILLDDGTRLDILNVEDLEERNEWLVMTARRTGTAIRAASQA